MFSYYTFGFILVIAATFNSAAQLEECDKARCKGPVRHYEDLQCKPIYNDPASNNSCCAVKYDCSHLANRSLDKCYSNGHEYSINDSLRAEDKWHACAVFCQCIKGENDKVAKFSHCYTHPCAPQKIPEGCYMKRTMNGSCCGEGIVCPQNGNSWECEVDDKVYALGDRFQPSKRPDLYCQCREGFRGQYTEEFCDPQPCFGESRYSYQVQNNCAPVFGGDQPPAYSCSPFYKCQNDKDVVIQAVMNKTAEESSDFRGSCKLGNTTLQIGDQLIGEFDSNSAEKARCTCEVPPVPTCLRIRFVATPTINFT